MSADASDLAATLRKLAERTDPAPWTSIWEGGESGCWVVDPVCMLGDTEDCGLNADFIAWCRNNAEALATALERGERSDRCHVDAVERFVALTTALMQSIADGEPQFVQLKLIGDSCDACDCVDDESIALYARAHAAAASTARDRERGAAAEAVVEALHGLYEATREISLLHDGERDGYYYAHIEPAFDRAGRELKRSEAALAAYDVLTEAPHV